MAFGNGFATMRSCRYPTGEARIPTTMHCPPDASTAQLSQSQPMALELSSGEVHHTTVGETPSIVQHSLVMCPALST